MRSVMKPSASATSVVAAKAMTSVSHGFQPKAVVSQAVV